MPLVTFESIHEILHTLFEQMTDLCGGMIHVASAIAGIGALLYISYRVWGSIAKAEPIDVFPLLRPFAIGICILFFDTLVIGGINGIMSPVVGASHRLMNGQTFDMQKFREDKDELEKQTASYVCDGLASEESHDEVLAQMEELGLDGGDLMTLRQMNAENRDWSLRGIFTRVLRWLLEFLFEFASLAIDTIRTFYLVVLAILGPIAFAISVYDGFQGSLTSWIAKYVSVYLWLPISDIFGAVLARLQVLSLQKDIEMMHTDLTYSFSADNGVYLVFLFIGICGYFTIPSIASWIVQASGFGSYNRIVTRTGHTILNHAAGVAGATMGNILGRMSHSGGGDKTKK